MDKKIHWIDNLKILGLLSIITFHFWPMLDPVIRDFSVSFKGWTIIQLPLRNGFQGTFLFFIASGTGLALLMNKKKITWLEFYRSRVLRIYIPYWIALAIALLFYFLGFNVSITPPTNALRWIANILLFDLFSGYTIQPHLWFLFAIIRLYALFPFIYWFAKKTGFSGLAGMFVLQFLAFSLYNIFPDPLLKTFLTRVLVWILPFHLGTYVGLMLVSNREKTERILHKLFPLGLIMWGVGTVANNYPKGNPITFTFISVGILIVVFKVASLNWRVPAINNISYETYLIHITVLALLSPTLKLLPTGIIYLIFLAISLCAGYLVKRASIAVYDTVRPRFERDALVYSIKPTAGS
ncbi:MAG TPA: acyltransferase [Anaerolineae bacterium]|jgi:peptidoglycan/LPS O-acetylase OafA/YrhL|nr:acyltransferase [Anaerolineae bacterium]